MIVNRFADAPLAPPRGECPLAELLPPALTPRPVVSLARGFVALVESERELAGLLRRYDAAARQRRSERGGHDVSA